MLFHLLWIQLWKMTDKNIFFKWIVREIEVLDKSYMSQYLKENNYF